jgi:hypothetical protein
MMRVVALVLLSAVLAAPLTFVAGMMLTRTLWRLEPVLGMELAGHSGPSEWIFWVFFGLFTVVLSIILLRLARGAATRPPSAAPATREPS